MKMFKNARIWLALMVLPALVLAACGADDVADPTNDAPVETTVPGAEETAAVEAVTLTVEPSAIAAFVALDRGFFEGVDVEVSTVGYEEAEALLLAGKTQIAWMGPLDVAQFAAEGEDFRYLSTAGALNMINGVVVRAEDAAEYKTINDLEGKKLGIPGFGTGTWATFQVFAKTYFDIGDPETEFEVVTADSGALLALLETGEIDAALLFAAQSAAGRYMDEFETIFSFTDAMQEEFGSPLVVNGPAATQEWAAAHPEAVQAVIDGLDRAVRWMTENPDAFRPDGEYADLGAGDGWHVSEVATDGILSLVASGEWYLTSDHYTDGWKEAVYDLIQSGEGSLVDSVPPAEEIFFEPAS